MDMSFFVQMGWKSALIAGAALGLAYVLRSRAASDRAMVLRIGVTMLLLLPLAALALPALQIEAFSAPEAPVAATAPATAPALDATAAYIPGPEIQLPGVQAGSPQPVATSTIWDDPTPLVILAYLGGLLMVGGRLLLGLFMLGRWTRAARDVTDPEWLAAFARVRGADDRTRLMVSDAVPSPLSWGWRNPVILIDPDTMDEPEEADAILAHEMAHVARRDWVSLMLTRVAAAAFWFNPVVWLLEREIVQQAEEAADSQAAAHVEPTRYAQTLLTWAQTSGRFLPANSIAPKQSALGRRIRAILDRRERPQGSAWARIAALTCIAVATPVAAVQLVHATQPSAPEAPAAPVAPGAAPAAPHAPRAPRAPVADLDIDIPDVSAEVHTALAEVLPRIPAIVESALSSVDAADIDRQVQEALRDADGEMRHMSSADRARVRAEVGRAMAQARAGMAEARAGMARARAEMQAEAPRIALAMQQAQAAAAAAPRAMATAMRSGSVGMARGAEGMERGARRMEEQARQLRDPAYREQQIARERARGHNVTHQDLIDAANGLQEGAQGMREGAREMREAARRMGDSDTD